MKNYTQENIKEDIANVLFENGLIDDTIYEKCGKPKYISDLPGDLRTTDQTVLSERLDAIEEEQDKLQKEYDEKYSEYEKQKEIEKTSRDNILQVGEDMVDVINAVWEEVTDNMGFNRYSLDDEVTEFEDEFGDGMVEEIDEDLISSYYQFYDNMVYAHDEFPEFNQALQDKLVRGDENAPTYRVRMENLIDAMVDGLDNGYGVSGYFDQWVTDDLKLIQKGIITTIPTEADKMEKATDKINQLESDLENIRKMQNDFRGEYDRTMGKLNS